VCGVMKKGRGVHHISTCIALRAQGRKPDELQVYISSSISVTEVFEITRRHFSRLFVLVHTAQSYIQVTYEDLTSDPGTTLTELYRFFGLDLAQLMTAGGSNHHNGGLAALLKKATTKKFTSENLEQLLANYGELSDWLSAKAPCYWPMLAAKGPESFAHCPLRFGSVHVHAAATSAPAATSARGH